MSESEAGGFRLSPVPMPSNSDKTRRGWRILVGIDG